MYKLGKRAISQYIRSRCQRRLRLDLYDSDGARVAANAPKKNTGRPGLPLLREQGRDYERQKYLELEGAFPAYVIRGALTKTTTPDRAFEDIWLGDYLSKAPDHAFLLEAWYTATPSFYLAHAFHPLAGDASAAVIQGKRVSFSSLRPDIIQVCPPGDEPRRAIDQRGEIVLVPAGDARRGLRIIDIKIAGEPSSSHFAELAYYGMVLAGWILDQKDLADRFVVLADAAIWPGSHEGSTIHAFMVEDHASATPFDLTRYLGGFGKDIEEMPAEVVLGRVRRFLSVDLLEALAARDWQDLSWHIDHRCVGCDYLGYRWARPVEDGEQDASPVQIDPLTCWPSAQSTGHLSRVTGLTEGACGMLREQNVTDVGAVAALRVGSPIFESHQTLKQRRTVLSQRAQTLHSSSSPSIPDRAGTSAVLPRFADIQVAISADFDVGSGLTFAFGYRLKYFVPIAMLRTDEDTEKSEKRWRLGDRTKALLVPKQSLESEAEILEQWIEYLLADIEEARREIMAGYRDFGTKDDQGRLRKRDARLQFYLWDRLTFDHLCRVFGRHLSMLTTGTNGDRRVAWLFPPEKLIPEPGFLSRSSPVAIVSDAASSLLAAPVPHHYGVIDVANSFDPDRRDGSGKRMSYDVHPLYRDPLSDQIPSERGLEMWEARSPTPKTMDPQEHEEVLRRVVRRKLQATIYVVDRLTAALDDSLKAVAPLVGSVFSAPSRLSKVGNDAQTFYQHTRLMAAAARAENALLMAMPPHEREARFDSARIDGVVDGDDRRTALVDLGLSHLTVHPDVMVLRLAPRSRDVRMREGDFDWSFLPESDLQTLQFMSVFDFKSLHPNVFRPARDEERHFNLRERLKVTVLKLDRAKQLLVVRPSWLLQRTLDKGLLDMNIDGSERRWAILDPIEADYFSSRLEEALSDPTGILHPVSAAQRPLFLGSPITRVKIGKPQKTTAESAAADLIWNADRTSRTPSGLTSSKLRPLIDRLGPSLTPKQKEAITTALDSRLVLWWGPPGTGKSATALVFLGTLILDAVQRQKTLRIAITGPTWVAIENVARRLPELLRMNGVLGRVRIARLLSGDSGSASAELAAYEVNTGSDHQRNGLVASLKDPGVTIVASTANQLAKLGADRLEPLFDVMLIDEASQLDVAHAIVAYTKLAPGARVTVVGDDKQMAPIHPIESPPEVAHMLGSIYDFYNVYRKDEPMPAGSDRTVKKVSLNRSFRSNREIIAFVREAGYEHDFDSDTANAGLRIETQHDPGVCPSGWPADLPWSPALGQILLPNDPLVAVIHSDQYSSQRNAEEAELIVALVMALYRAHLKDLGSNNQVVYDDPGFFQRGIGIVTPHRAQQAAVIDRLSACLPPGPARREMFTAVDTVERFQGQERAVMLASFGLGDLDQIAAEETFLYSLNRFNVTVSRARAKFIAVLSRRLVDHLPKDRRALEESRLIKHFVDGYLRQTRPIEFGKLRGCMLHTR